MSRADDRIPFPHTDAPLACRTDPKLFAIDDIANRAEREKTLATAKRACSGCPIVTSCLKWALANPELTPTGVWAATTHRDRNRLRKNLTQRLGTDWVGAVAEQDRRKQEKQRAARINPPTVREQAIARLDVELIPIRPAPYEPWKEPMTPSRQARNRAVLGAALSTKEVA
ncbi:WhiB family transcriptional regulator [Streptomyces botrytidirepellens]|uniref:WhiB family transcriptional regulator n=1 Tax=Streptomyces botrytidirepellens TaxID=2486417 RepID=A0A3M8X0Q8_9ACTN|nr:WhiB family transcriptional regulator [Streptomyces botrytidirepellens]RNG34365.1 WhiB family transcriptional regulator [Streptomyces botrytidirepellens]